MPSWRYDSATEIDVIEEVARHHGYTAHRAQRPDRPRTPGASAAARLERRRLRSLLVGRGLSEAMPLPFLAPGDLERCGLPDDGIEIANPLVAEESVLRTSLLPGLVKALAYNCARRNTAWGSGRSATSSGAGTRSAGGSAPRATPCPTSGRCSAWRSAVATPPRPCASGVQSPRCWAWKASTIENGEVPGLHPTRSARLVGAAGEPVGARGRDRPGRARRPRHRRAGRLARGRPRRRCSTCRTANASTGRSASIRRATSTSPSRSTTPCRRRPSRPRCGRRPATTWRRSGCSTSTGARASPTAGAAWPTRSGCDAPDHTLTDDEVAEIRRRCIDAVESAYPASLRG